MIAIMDTGDGLRRRMPVRLAFALAALVLAGSFVWAFVVEPRLKAIQADAHAAKPPPVSGSTRPSERITSQPASYEQASAPVATAGALPAPRVGGADAASGDAVASVAATTGSPATAATSDTPSPLKAARQSGLFFSAADDGRVASAAPRGALGVAGDVAATGPVGSTSLSPQAQADYDAVYGRHVLLAPRSPYEVKAGTIVPAALLTAVDTGRAGPVVAVTTAPVFDTVTGRTLLIPQGSRLIGAEAGDSAYGERRAYLLWKRLILPDGKSLILDDQAGVDATGADGVPGHADVRWAQLGGAILLSGAITTLGQVAESGDNSSHPSLLGDAGDATAIQAVQVGGRLIDRELRVQPKVHVPSGAPVEVLLTKDLVLEPAS
jgi:type IV secretory pathway VirB10-like protein